MKVGAVVAVAVSVAVWACLKNVPDLGYGECDQQSVPATMEILPEFPLKCGLQEFDHKRSDEFRIFAYTQKGGWCWSNAGAVYDVAKRKITLIDVLTDIKRTSNMLKALERALPEGKLGSVIFTHCDIDHIAGLQLIYDRVDHIYAGEACQESMRKFFGSSLGKKVKVSHYAWTLLKPVLSLLPASIARPAWAAPFSTAEILGPFDFDKVDYERFQGVDRLVTTPVTDTLHLDFGSIVPMNVSSHSDHDLMVDVAGTVRFTGDILFNGITPLNWAGDFSQSIQACHQSASWEGYFVPGHGAIQHSRQNPFKKLLKYWRDLLDHVKKCEGEGVPLEACALSNLGPPYNQWADPKRSFINIMVNADPTKVNKFKLIGEYARWAILGGDNPSTAL